MKIQGNNPPHTRELRNAAYDLNEATRAYANLLAEGVTGTALDQTRADFERALELFRELSAAAEAPESSAAPDGFSGSPV